MKRIIPTLLFVMFAFAVLFALVTSADAQSTTGFRGYLEAGDGRMCAVQSRLVPVISDAQEMAISAQSSDAITSSMIVEMNRKVEIDRRLYALVWDLYQEDAALAAELVARHGIWFDNRQVECVAPGQTPPPLTFFQP